MPTYCYETDDGEIIERQFPMGKAPDVIYPQGPCVARCKSLARRCLRAEIAGQVASVKGSDTPVIPRRKNWPMTCVSSGVHASQAGELREYLRKSGVPTEVTPDGDPIYTSPQHRRKALKARNMFDKSGYL